MADTKTITAIFWSRGRREFVEVTVEDAQRRMAAPKDVAFATLERLANDGVVSRSKINLGNIPTSTWYLNKEGRSVVRRYLEESQS